jgi:hypothetical protein
MLATARSGLPLKFVAQAGGIAYDVFLDWRGRDPEFDRALEEARLASVQERWEQIMKLGNGTEEKPGAWKALAWSLERTEASSFARPEVQLHLATNIVRNNLTITIAPEEVREIEAQSAPIREKVRQMFAAYRPDRAMVTGSLRQRFHRLTRAKRKACLPLSVKRATRILRCSRQFVGKRRGSSAVARLTLPVIWRLRPLPLFGEPLLRNLKGEQGD